MNLNNKGSADVPGNIFLVTTEGIDVIHLISALQQLPKMLSRDTACIMVAILVISVQHISLLEFGWRQLFYSRSTVTEVGITQSHNQVCLQCNKLLVCLLQQQFGRIL